MSATVYFDPELMRRYDREGPRYTSYPTAVQFRDGWDAPAYEAAATGSRGALELSPLSLYVHVPFCRSPCLYCGCNKVVTRQTELADSYVAHLITEISMRSRYFAASREVEQLHFGGGTPTFLPLDRLEAIIDALDRFFHLSAAAHRDYSIEIDPRTVDEAYLAALSRLGFNRISIGVQEFDHRVQAAINRIQPAAMVAHLLGQARGLGFQSINFDLIYGLPQQTLETFGTTLDQVIAMRPDRLAVYGYAHMPHLFKAQRQIDADTLPDAPTRLALLQLAIAKLTEAGYVYIGMDHFALPSDSLATAQRDGTLHRSFQGYTTHASRDLVSFGVSAIGQVGDLYVQNQKSLGPYLEAIERGELPMHRGVLRNQDDVLRADVIQQIMCHGRIDVAATERRFGIDFPQYFAPSLQRLAILEQDRLVERSAAQITLTARGRLLMRNVAMAFDDYLHRQQATARLSRAV